MFHIRIRSVFPDIPCQVAASALQWKKVEKRTVESNACLKESSKCNTMTYVHAQKQTGRGTAKRPAKNETHSESNPQSNSCRLQQTRSTLHSLTALPDPAARQSPSPMNTGACDSRARVFQLWCCEFVVKRGLPWRNAAGPLDSTLSHLDLLPPCFAAFSRPRALPLVPGMHTDIYSLLAICSE